MADRGAWPGDPIERQRLKPSGHKPSQADVDALHPRLLIEPAPKSALGVVWTQAGATQCIKLKEVTCEEEGLKAGTEPARAMFKPRVPGLAFNQQA